MSAVILHSLTILVLLSLVIWTNTRIVKGVEIPFSRQIHIALNPMSNGTNEMSISWVTYSEYSNENDSVLYVTDIDPSTHNNDIKNISTIYPSYQLSNAEFSRYYHHSVISSDLVPNTQYYYQCGNNGTIRTFTARSINKNTNKNQGTNTNNHNNNNNNHKKKQRKNEDNNNNNNPVSIILFGDMGVDHSNNTLQLTKNMIDTSDIDFVMHVGDIAYCDDRDLVGSNPKYMPIYDEWANEMEQVFDNTPYMVSPGNHEQTCHSWADEDCPYSLRNFTNYRLFWNMPNSTSMYNNGYYKSESSHNMFYSYNYQNIHFISISTETDYPGAPDQEYKHTDIINPEGGPFGNQTMWLQTDLENARNNEDIDWIIVVGHRPLYTSARDEEHLDWPPQTPYFLQKAFDNVFYQYNVDLYISGHIHSYERLYPIYDHKVTTFDYLNPKSTIYLVQGAAGSIEGHGSSIPNLKNYTAVYDNKHWGVAKLTIFNQTTILWEFIDADSKNVCDSVWINKGFWQ